MNRYFKIALLAFGHLLVDLEGIYLIQYMNIQMTFENIAIYFLAYNFVAFALQPIAGYIADRNHLYLPFVLIGLFLPATVLMFPWLGLMAVVIATLGNAMYHVGGGVMSVQLFPGKAAPAGVFVAPGAIGVFLGLTLATSGTRYQPFIVIIALVVIALLYLTFKRDLPKPSYGPINKNLVKITLLLLVVVLIRGLIGLNLVWPWRSETVAAVALVSAVFLGKFLGGFLGDRFGFEKVGLFGLVASFIFLLIGNSLPVLGMIGAFLFNFTMAITLFVIIDSYGRYKGFAFGLTTLALFLAYLPTAFGVKMSYDWTYAILMFVFVSLAVVSYHFAMVSYHKGK